MKKILSKVSNFLDPYKDKTDLAREVRESIETISQMGFHFISKEGMFLDFKSFTVPSDQFVPFAEGMGLRVMDNKSQFLNIEEKVLLKEHLKDVDFKNGTVLISKNVKGAHAPKHYHIERELLIVANGCMKLTLYEKSKTGAIEPRTITMKKGDRVEIPKMVPHSAEMLDDTLIIANLVPKLPSLIKN